MLLSLTRGVEEELGHQRELTLLLPADKTELLIQTTNGTAVGSDSGLSILHKDTWTCELEEQGIEPLIFRLVDDLLCLLSPIDIPRMRNRWGSESYLDTSACIPQVIRPPAS